MSDPRIYDQPNHSAYGPVRRLNVMVLQLFADRDLEKIEKNFGLAHDEWTWDDMLAFMIEQRQMSEAKAQRYVLERLLAIG